MKSSLGFVCALLLLFAIVYAAIAYQLRRTVFSADFAFAEIEQADPARVVKSMLLEYLPADASPVLLGAVDTSIEQQRPWLVAELRKAVVAFQDYLRGAEGRIQVQIDPAPLRAAILDNLQKAVQAGDVPELQRLPLAGRVALEAAARQEADAVFAQVSAFRFDSEALTPDRQAQLLAIRQRLALFQRPLIIVLCAVVALGFIAGVLGALRQAALATLAAGVVLLAPTMFSSQLAGLLPLPSLSSLPAAVAAYLPTLSDHLMAPLRPAAIAALVVGGGLLGLSFVLPSRRPSRSRRR